MVFYQKQYTQGFTTDCPSDNMLKTYLEQKFIGTEKDFSNYVNILLAACKKGDKLFDFGCSWGYGSWQFKQHGFNVESFEISKPRADFARNKLNIKVYSYMPDVKSDTYDIFFSSHVLEHVPSVMESIEFGMRILKPNGLFVAFTPNGSEVYRKTNYNSWNKLWGMVHPNFLDDKFYKNIFANKSYILLSNPYPIEEIKQWNMDCITNTRETHHEGELTGNELLVLARK
jgi:2-polyprenyl-3-methyl-5-hydroxy-6-metoxy-1,4-benzoquinol methylase